MADAQPQVPFDILKDRVLSSIQTHFPVQVAQRTLELKKVWADDTLSETDIADQLKAKENEQTWGVPVRGELVLKDNRTGKVISEQTVQLATIPKMTSRYSFIVDGGEYQVDHLLRLKSGIYARVSRAGDYKSEWNLRKGKNFDITLDRAKKQLLFTFKNASAQIPVYPLLKGLGVADDEIEQTLGKDIFAANKVEKPQVYERALKKFWEKTKPREHRGDAPDLESLKQHVANYFGETELYGDTTKLTLGKPFTKVTGEAMLSAVRKLVDVSKGAKADDRDSLVFKEVVHFEDFIPEKLDRSWKKIHHKIRTTMGYKDDISQILQGGHVFRQPINEFFTTGGDVTERGEQTNPLLMLSANFKTTTVAPHYGGIKDPEKLGDEMRAINPSHFGFLDPMHTPESERTGITLHLGSAVRKNGKELEVPVYDPKLGKVRPSKVTEFHNATVALPDHVRWENGKPTPLNELVKVKLPGGDIAMRPFKDCDLVLRSAKGIFSYASNSIPFLPCDQGNRTSMADKQMEQAISLKHREAPLVQAQLDEKNPSVTYDKVLGSSFASTKSPVAGKVVKVVPGEIHIKEGRNTHIVQTYHHFPLNDPKGEMHSEPVVKEGDVVKSGQLLADSNYTRNGTMALGTNLRVAYLPYKGYNFEDGIVVSETAAKKLTSEHLHKLKLEVDTDVEQTDPRTWRANNSRKVADAKPEHFDMLDKDGVIKVGAKVQPGQVLATCLTPNLDSARSQAMRERFNERGVQPWKDKSLTWDEDYEGTVVRVVKPKSGKKVQVYVTTEEPAVIGDKLSGRHGNKGIITKILPDEQMPFHLGEGGEKKHVDVLLNPSGVPTRMNLGQMLETAVAKIAEKTGTPYVVNNFSKPKNEYSADVEKDLVKHGIKNEGEEILYDPEAKGLKALGSVLTGPQYILKLKHQVEKKLAVRGGDISLTGRPYSYDADRQPSKGGSSGAQGFGALEMYALLGHNARGNLREMATYKSDQQGRDFWDSIRDGLEPPPPKVPFAYWKFESLLKGLGVDVKKEGTKLRLTPMTDREVLHLADGGKNEILEGHKIITRKNLKEEKNGLFDIHATGGLEGTKWGFIRLAEPMPNPIFVGGAQTKGPIPTLLDKSIASVDAVMNGREMIDGKTGGHAIRDALAKIDVDAEIKKTRELLPQKRGTVRDNLNKKLKYLTSLKDLGLKPHEAYVLNYLPVVPPVVRPITPTPRGDIVKSSLNELYRTFSLLNRDLKEADPKLYGHTAGRELRSSLWNSFKALQAIGKYEQPYDPDSHGERSLKGITDIIGGKSGEQQPKEGFFQSKLMKRQQDLSIRSTIVPEPTLHLDEVGVPKVAAMELYRPFVVAQLQQQYGFKPSAAVKECQSFSDISVKALQEAMDKRPLLLKRDPALHKFSIMAFRPKIVDGKAIKIHPLVCGGFNADFDGDTMAGTVPVTKQAVDEAFGMLPSKNLFSPTSYGTMYAPSQEALVGLHLITKWGKKTDHTFSSLDDLKKAHEEGHVGLTDVVALKGARGPTTLGRMLIAEKMPAGFSKSHELLHDQNFSMTKDTLGGIVDKLAREHKDEFDKAVNHLKDLGNEHSYKAGFSIGLKDIRPLPERDEILDRAHKAAAHAHATIKNKDDREGAVVDIYNAATKEIERAAQSRLANSDNRLGTMVYSKARGKPEQLRQMIAAPMLMSDASGRVLTTPVTRSYSEGLDLGDYWLTQHGARKGTLQRASGTKDPGALTKDIINATISTLIVSDDCGTSKGISMPLDHKDLHDRFLAEDIHLRDGTHYKAGSTITQGMIDKMRAHLGTKVDIQVRSPLKCQHGDGICAKCFGLNEHGKLHATGTNIGVLAGQSMGEPATQLAMDSFHSGGLAVGRGGASVSRIERLRELLKMPAKLKNQATIATVSGTIVSVKPSATGGHDVHISPAPGPNGEKYPPVHHWVEKLESAVQEGATVKRGRSLSHEDVPVNPKELLAVTKDMPRVQQYLTKELYKGLYEKEGVRQRNIETVVRAMTNYTRVKDPGTSHWNVGDIVPHSVIEEYNRQVHGREGEHHVVHEPMLKGSEGIPQLTGNWLAQLNYRNLRATLIHGAARGQASDIHSSHPVPAYAVGTEFGRPPPNKPKHVY